MVRVRRVRLTVWKNEELNDDGLMQVSKEPVFDEEMEDITTARMFFYKEFYHGYNGDIKDDKGDIIAPLR